MPEDHNGTSERSPLLSEDGQASKQTVDFSPSDPENPRNWSRFKKYSNMVVIALMALVSPLGSAMFNPAIPDIAEELNTTTSGVVASTTGFLVFLGIGPLLLAPLSETFGRRNLYLVCFTAFGLLQIPCALSKNIETLVVFRAISGFFGSVGIANGGGTLSDMFEPRERAGVYGYYLLGPLLGPTIGPMFGGLIMEYTKFWPWIFYTLAIVSGVNTIAGFLFLRESYAPVILARRKRDREFEQSKQFTYQGEDTRPLRTRLLQSIKRPIKILFLQPIVFVMAMYQAILYGIMFTLFTQIPIIFSAAPYNFSSLQVGLLYISPGIGALLAVVLLVPRIDTVFNKLTERNDGISQPEYRLPLANIGSVLGPASLLWFGWSINNENHWAVSISALPLFSIGLQVIFSSAQNYYIDAFERYSASAIAAGSVFRAIVGGIIPIIVPSLFDALGYGWGFTCLAGVTICLAPAPIVFFYYGRRIRERFAFEL